MSISYADVEQVLTEDEATIWKGLDTSDVVAKVELKYAPELLSLSRRKSANRPPDFEERDRKASACIRAAGLAFQFENIRILMLRIGLARVERNRIAEKALELADLVDAHPEYGPKAHELQVLIEELRASGKW